MVASSNDYVAVYTLAAGRSCNDIHVCLKCAVGDEGGVYVTPPKLLLLQIKLNWAGFVGGPVFFPFSDFLPVCWQEFDSKFILYRWKRVFVGIYKKKGLGPDRTPSARTSPPHPRNVYIVTIQGSKGTCIPSQDRSNHDTDCKSNNHKCSQNALCSSTSDTRIIN